MNFHWQTKTEGLLWPSITSIILDLTGKSTVPPFSSILKASFKEANWESTRLPLWWIVTHLSPTFTNWPTRTLSVAPMPWSTLLPAWCRPAPSSWSTFAIAKASISDTIPLLSLTSSIFWEARGRMLNGSEPGVQSSCARSGLTPCAVSISQNLWSALPLSKQSAMSFLPSSAESTFFKV